MKGKDYYLQNGNTPSAKKYTEKHVDTSKLIQLIKSKKEVGFTLLYERYSYNLLKKLEQIIKRKDIAEDQLQEVFVKIWRHIDDYDSRKGTLFTWMIKIARNHALDYLRSASYQRRLKEVDEDIFSIQIERVDPTNTISEMIERKDIKDKIIQLDSKYAEVLDLIFFYGWTQQQTAQILGLPLGTVKTRVRKGLSMMKEKYLIEPSHS